MTFCLSRRVGLLVALAASVLATGCAKNVVPPPVPVPKAVVYAALGASDAVGYGASVPCDPAQLVAAPTCPGGTGYVPLIARSLATTGATVTLDDRGISGAVIGPDLLATIDTYGSVTSAAPCLPRTGNDRVPADFISNELPALSGTETLVTIFAGGNETVGLANAVACLNAAGMSASQVQAFVTSEIAAFGTDLTNLIAAVRAKAPAAKIVVANLPNFAGLPFAQTLSPSARAILQSIAVGIDTTIYQPTAVVGLIPVVDLLCDPNSYVAANFSGDGFHPNDAGYAAFAAAFEAQINAATPTLPQTSCAQMTIASRSVRPLAEPLPNFDRR